MTCLILIGLPGAGKSTMGVILAKALGRTFIDTDIRIQEETGRLLQEIIDTDGQEAFLAFEETTILALDFPDAVIATGGSVVYSTKAMRHLRTDGIIIYLAISYNDMMGRLDNITTRGILLHPGESLREMFDERVPLYASYADITIDCSGRQFEECVRQVVDELGKRGRVAGVRGEKRA